MVVVDNFTMSSAMLAALYNSRALLDLLRLQGVNQYANLAKMVDDVLHVDNIAAEFPVITEIEESSAMDRFFWLMENENAWGVGEVWRETCRYGGPWADAAFSDGMLRATVAANSGIFNDFLASEQGFAACVEDPMLLMNFIAGRSRSANLAAHPRNVVATRTINSTSMPIIHDGPAVITGIQTDVAARWVAIPAALIRHAPRNALLQTTNATLQLTEVLVDRVQLTGDNATNRNATVRYVPLS